MSLLLVPIYGEIAGQRRRMMPVMSEHEGARVLNRCIGKRV